MINRITDCAIITTDAVGSIISWNSYAQTLYGYEQSEIIGKSIATLYTPEAIKEDEPAANLQLALLNTNRNNEELRVKKDGSTFNADINCTAIFNREHELVAYTEISQDIKKIETAGKQPAPKTTAKKPPYPFIAGDMHFKKLIENSYEGVTLLDKNFNVIYRSLSAERINGWNTIDRIKTTLDGVIYPDDKEQVRKILHDVLINPGQPMACTFRSKHRKGHFIWLECVFTNFLNDPDINAIVCNFRDITEKKRADEVLEQTIKELFDYKYALDNSAIVAITDQKGIINHVNNNFCKISKYSREELIGQDHRIINSSYHDKAFIHNLWATIAGGKIWKGELKNKAKDGGFYWVDTTIVPFLNGKGKPYQYIAIRSDITERKLNEEKIIENASFIKTVTDNVPALITYWTEDLRCLFANKPGLKWFDKQLHEIQGIAKRELLGEDEYMLHEGHIKNVLNGEAQSFERSFYNSEGKSIYNHTHYLPDMENGKVKGFYSLIYDISEIKLAEQEINRKTEQIENILESIGDAFFAVDKSWVITYWNNMAEKYMGKTRDEVLNKNIWEIYPDAVNSPAYAKYQEAFETNKTVHFELYSIYLRNWSDISVYPTGNGLSVYIRDINERKKAELVAARSQEEKNTILESIDDAFFAVDKNWMVTYWNKTAETALGKTKEEMINNYLWGVFSDSIDSLSYKKYHEAIETNQAVHFEDYYAPLIKWYDVSAYPTGNGLSVYFKDITERKLADIQLKELNLHLQKQAKELAISNAELEQFAYVASHDLQEPLRMVTGFLSQIEKKYGQVIDDKGKQYIHFAVDGAKRMRQIILDLLEFSRVGREEGGLEEVDLNKVVNGILALYRRQIEEQNAKITSDDLPVLQTLRVPVRQVFQNLISNGLKYQKHGVSPLINISCEEIKGYWRFSVKDNGIGIEAEYFDKIFIIFQRLHNKDEYSGTGMGLAVTKKIIENLGGSIWVKSEEGKGSTFYFTILKH